MNFTGNTFVAFIDISGFKVMMRKHKEKAYRSLDAFFQTGYDVLQEETGVNGIFISDCGILFSREGNQQEQLEDLLRVVKAINKKMLDYDVMLTTNIAYGDFSYQNRIELQGIRKNMIYGNAYLNAYSDSLANPKMEPSQCRVLIDDNISREILNTNEFLKPQGRKHYYYYWSVESSENIEFFKNAYGESKYKGILNVLKTTEFMV
ncbi:hypothetical protein [Capnocytophaga canimorsus]|uniref:hypothetical protein n=1 Tax=Capnocytophaga canimorsus TaxID=28188 RepID=UPI001561C1A3|nr:hypothetical protein [Capnocytophaga canimorsus]